MNKALNIKNMKETLVNYSGGNREEYNRIWGTFRDMANLGFISSDSWNKFFNQTESWIITDDDYLLDTKTEKIIFDFDNGARNNRDYEEYRA